MHPIQLLAERIPIHPARHRCRAIFRHQFPHPVTTRVTSLRGAVYRGCPFTLRAKIPGAWPGQIAGLRAHHLQIKPFAVARQAHTLWQPVVVHAHMIAIMDIPVIVRHTCKLPGPGIFHIRFRRRRQTAQPEREMLQWQAIAKLTRQRGGLVIPRVQVWRVVKQVCGAEHHIRLTDRIFQHQRQAVATLHLGVTKPGALAALVATPVKTAFNLPFLKMLGIGRFKVHDACRTAPRQHAQQDHQTECFFSNYCFHDAGLPAQRSRRAFLSILPTDVSGIASTMKISRGTL